MSATRKITFHSPVGSDSLFIRTATIVEQLGRPFDIHIDLFSVDEKINFDKLLGKEAHIEVALDEGKSRAFHGFLSEFAQTGRSGRHATYRARIVPWLWFLTRTADCRIFQGKTVPEIIDTVFSEHGFTDYKPVLTKTYRKRDYCVQYRETDFNFLQRLMEEEGIYYFFVHKTNNHKLMLVDSYSGHESMEGYATIEYFPPSQNESREKDHIYEWSHIRNIQPGKYTITDYDFTKPRAKLETFYKQKREFARSDYEIFDYPGGYLTAAEGDHYARARLESLQAQYERFIGTSNARGQAAGHLFKLKGYPRQDQDKEYLVVRATYQLVAGDYESGGDGEDADFTCHFEAIDAKEPFRTEISTRKPIVGGPQTATVVGPDGEEIHTDKYARVKVKFHWDRAPARNESSSCWVRVSQIWAGKNWGWMTIPRIGQEVVVDFLEGDPDQPLITGRVYNQDNLPPYDLPANKTQSGIKTRSTKGGAPENFNEIRFEDLKGSEQLYIHAEKNQDIVVKNDETHSVGNDRTKTIDHDETTHVKHDRTETVDNNETITIGKDRSESVGANESISIANNRTEDVGADESITIGRNRTVDVGSNESITIGSDQTSTIGRNRSEEVGGNETITINGNRTESVAKAEQVSIGKSRTVDISENDALSIGKKLVIDAGDQITIKAGSASITLKKDGTITIKGKDITLDGSGKINAKASGDVVIKGSKVTQN